MRRIVLCYLVLLTAGCSNGAEHLKTLIQDPLRDPHYAEYQQKTAELESIYLGKKITYAEYVEQKKGLDDQYEKEVKERNEKIQAQ